MKIYIVRVTKTDKLMCVCHTLDQAVDIVETYVAFGQEFGANVETTDFIITEDTTLPPEFHCKVVCPEKVEAQNEPEL